MGAHINSLQPIDYDICQLRLRHPRHSHLNYGTLDRSMFPYELVHIIGDSYQNNGSRDNLIA